MVDKPVDKYRVTPKMGNRVVRTSGAIHLGAGITCGNARKRSRRVWGNGCVPLGTPVPPAHLAAVVGLTGGQRLVVVLVLAGFVIELFLWPVIRRTHRSDSVMDKHRSHNRLMHELQKHGDDVA